MQPDGHAGEPTRGRLNVYPLSHPPCRARVATGVLPRWLSSSCSCSQEILAVSSAKVWNKSGSFSANLCSSRCRASHVSASPGKHCFSSAMLAKLRSAKLLGHGPAPNSHGLLRLHAHSVTMSLFLVHTCSAECIFSSAAGRRGFWETTRTREHRPMQT